MKTIPKKIWIIIAAAVVVIAVGIIVAVNLFKKDDVYRTILVYQITGDVTIERENIGKMDAYENLILQSGDIVTVSANSNMRLKLDDDKYVMVEPDSEFTIYAEGNKQDSKTKIELRKGAITNEIQNSLNDNSSYEVTTPNSIMAVRGTVFRVAVEIDNNGDNITVVATFDGNVASKLVMPDGAVIEQETEVKDGKQVVIKGTTEDSEYVSEPEDIKYEELPKELLQFLIDVVDNGGTISISKEEINVILGNDTEEETTTEETTTEETTTEETTTEEKEEDKCTVTFMYNGQLFGTQEVEKGKNATAPMLNPSDTGEWDYDFEQPVTADITIEWK